MGLEAMKNEPAARSHILIDGECYVYGLANGQGLDIAQKECMSLREMCIV